MLSTTTTGKRPLATVFEKAPRTLFAYLGGEGERGRGGSTSRQQSR
jgi:hypothetical protein